MSFDAGLRKSLNIIIKKYLHREVVLTLTAVKLIPGKYVFKDFKFCSCLQGTYHSYVIQLKLNLNIIQAFY